MKFEIEINEYIGSNEIKSVIKDTLITEIKNVIHRDRERILNNMAYSLVQESVDEFMDGKMKEQIRNKAVQVIGEMSSYCVFSAKDVWGKEASVGWTELQKAMADNKHSITEKVIEIIKDYDYVSAIYNDNSAVSESIIELMKRGLESKNA